MAEVTITVHGTPAPQGSKRAFVGKNGRAHVIESSHDRVKSWRQAIIDQVRSEVTLDGPIAGPVALEIAFYLKRPKGHYGTGKNASRLRDSAPRRPAKMPDLSKLIRSTEDALSDAGTWEDDSLVVDITASKYWADVQFPGAIITIRQYGD